MSNRQIYAFTLAEVLITMGIIGVIAALTLGIINKANDMERISKVKKAYSNIMNATNMIMRENGGNMAMSVDGLNGNFNNDITVISTFYKNKYKERISTQADCDTKVLCSGKLWPIDTEWYSKDGTTIASQGGGYGFYGAIIGLDGISYRLYIHSNNCDYAGTKLCGQIMFDINGLKKPNQMDKDIFLVLLYKYKLSITSSELSNILQK